MKKQTRRGEPTLASRFPYLAASPSISETTRRELAETEVELARRLRRGKNGRLKELTQLENELELMALRKRLDRLSPVEDLLCNISGKAITLLEAQQDISSAHRAEAIFALDSIQIRPELRLLPHAKPEVIEALKDLRLDEIGIALFRYLTSVDKSHVTSIGKQKKISRQSIWERSRRLQSKMWELRKLKTIQSLVDSIETRNTKSGWNNGSTLPDSDPLIRLAFDYSSEVFPSVSDVVRLGLWIWSANGYEQLVSIDFENWNAPLGVISSPTPLCDIPGLIFPNDFEEFDPGLSDFVEKAFKDEPK